MPDLRPLHRVLLAIEAYRSAWQIDPSCHDPNGPTARAVDGLLGLDEGRTRMLVYSVADRGFVLSMPPWRGAAQRLSLTDAGRAFLEAGCPLQLRGRGTDG